MEKLVIIGGARSNFVWAVRAFAEERAVPYDHVPEMPHQGEAARINPFGKIPVMKHGDVELSETRAIAGYIDAAFPGLRLFPSDPRKAAEVERWISVANTECDGPIIRRYVVPIVFAKDGKPDEAVVAKAAKALPPLFARLDAQVARNPYLAGDAFSYADCAITPMLFYAGRFPEGKEALSAAPHLQAYLGRMMERPSVRASAPSR